MFFALNSVYFWRQFLTPGWVWWQVYQVGTPNHDAQKDVPNNSSNLLQQSKIFSPLVFPRYLDLSIECINGFGIAI